MDAYGRRVIIDLKFERTLGEAIHAILDEGLQVIGQIDVRDHFRRGLRRDFRKYVLLQVWSPEIALYALKRDLRVGTILPTTLAVYELDDGETAVVANEPLFPAFADRGPQMPGLAVLAAKENERIARILARVQQAASRKDVTGHAA